MSDPAAFFLPTHTTPSHYTLALTPDLEAFTFTGTTTIDVTHEAETSTVVVHAKELEFSLVHYNGEAVASYSHNAETEQLTIELGSTAAAGSSGKLSFDFTGILNDQMAGFYRSSYEAPDGSGTRYAAVTQFEATDARRAFPCFDEPKYKATFDVTLIAPADRVVLSNMDVKSEEVTGSVKTVVFNRTVSMSTYLVAFVIGEFDYIEAATSIGSIPIRVYTPVGLGEQGQFALDVAVAALDYYQDYYAKEYPLPKLDMVAINDFAAGAMENWGLVTYRSVLVLYDPETTPASIKERIAYVVCHELAHQWFGNLVTMVSWTYLYLNEAFATYVGWAATHEQFPDWKVWDSYVVGDLSRALDLDALQNSHPVEVEITNPNKVDEIFDAISYSKGSAVLRMLVAFVGEDDFREGMRAYVAKFAYANTTSGDLWACLSEASGKDVAGMMGSWVDQTGYPVVSVTRVDDTTVRVSQTRYLSTGPESVPADAADALWKVPLRVVNGTAPGEVQDVLLTEKTMDLTVPAGAWVKLNDGQIGFYRVQYDAESIGKLSEGDALSVLPAADRVGLVNDVFCLAAAGYGSTPLALNLIETVGASESEYIVWADMSSSLGEVGKVWNNSTGLKVLTGKLFGPLAAKLGWDKADGESYAVSQLRPVALARSIKSGVADVVAEATARFEAGTVHPDLRASVYRALFAVSEGDTAVAMHAKLVEMYKSATSQDTRVVLLSALGGAPTAELAELVIEWAAESGDVRNQDFFYIVGSLSSSAHGKVVVWEHVKANFDALAAKFQGAFLLARIIKITVSAFASQAELDDINAFFADKDKAAFDRPLKQAIEAVTARIAWQERDGPAVLAWLDNHA